MKDNSEADRIGELKNKAICLLLKDETCLSRWATGDKCRSTFDVERYTRARDAHEQRQRDKGDQATRYRFDVEDALLSFVQRQHDDYGTLLTRESLNLLADRSPLTPAEKCALLTAFTRCKTSTPGVKADDFGAIIDTLDAYRREQAIVKAFTRYAKDRDEAALLDAIRGAEPAEPVAAKADPLAVDLSRFPEAIRRGLSGLAAMNPMLPLSAQVLVPFALAGAMIGKRMKATNFENVYYPNLWNVVIAGTNTNKTGTRNLLLRSLPLDVTLPDSATMEALLERRLGRAIATSREATKAEVSAARVAAIREDEQAIDGGVIVADEVTGTFKKLLGGDARSPDRNVEDVLRLATSGERIEQPRIGSGYRIAADLCVSVIGFTQAETWEAMFGDDRHKSSGFIGRVIPCCDGLRLDGLPIGRREDWQAFVDLTTSRLASFRTAGNRNTDDWLPDPSKQDEQRSVTFNVTNDADPIRDSMARVKQSEAWRVLAQTVGEYAAVLNGKVIGHAIKLAMACELFEGSAAGWFEPCAELVAACYANYFRSTYGSRRGLSTIETKAIAFVRANPGVSANDVRKKLAMRDNRDIYPLIDSLIESGQVERRDGRRRNTFRLYVVDRG